MPVSVHAKPYLGTVQQVLGTRPYRALGSVTGYYRLCRGNRRVGVLVRAETPRRFTDFLEPSDTKEEKSRAPTTKPVNAETKAEDLIERTTAVLNAAREALNAVRAREPSDSRYRRSGNEVVSGPTVKSTSIDASEKVEAKSPASSRPAVTTLSFAWESDTDEEDDVPFSGSGSGSSIQGGSSPSSSSSSSSSFSALDNGPVGLDSWFGGKVDTGSLHINTAMRSTQLKESPNNAEIAVLDRPNLPASLQFAPPEAPVESGAASIFPESLALRFQSSSEEAEFELSEEQVVAAAEQDQGTWERTSGEEYGPNGYWYRWTETKGRDATGKVEWFERWWEVSDWKGMKEMGAEKWGNNDIGDAWRESWRETIGFDEATGQPRVERTAHKWARAGDSQEWEEKWGENYLSGGKADKWADKWGRDGSDVWHERWGENYDGHGGCVKWTDRWAERENEGGFDKWGDKWEEKFKDGRGTKQGETWTESGNDRYQRWWGENHFGDGTVQKHGHSTTGEHWDSTETMDTYYNPIPHFGYDLALAHSPQLRSVPMLPRDALDLALGGGDGGDDNNDDNGLGALFG